MLPLRNLGKETGQPAPHASSAPPRTLPGPRDVVPEAPTMRPGPLGILSETAPAHESIGVYIHVPFCTKKCYFCSFNTAPMDDGAMRRYLLALSREIELVATAPWASRVRIESVFFGGGTPSLLSGDGLGAVLSQLRARFALAADAEITVESNP